MKIEVMIFSLFFKEAHSYFLSACVGHRELLFYHEKKVASFETIIYSFATGTRDYMQVDVHRSALSSH